MCFGGQGRGELAELQRVKGNAVAEEGRLGITGGMECSVSQIAAL